MGFGSFLTSDTQTAIQIGSPRPVALLLPDEAPLILSHYDGYGRFALEGGGLVNVYQLLAERNGFKSLDPDFGLEDCYTGEDAIGYGVELFCSQGYGFLPFTLKFVSVRPLKHIERKRYYFESDSLSDPGQGFPRYSPHRDFPQPH